MRGQWIDPADGMVTLTNYAKRWSAGKTKLEARTTELYEEQLRLHILPYLGSISLKAISPGHVREWNSQLLKESQLSPNSVAKCYRLLKSILNTAVEDELILRNPCTIKNGGREQYVERPIPSTSEVFALAAEVGLDRRLLILLAAYAGLRIGELLALKRRHVDLLHTRIMVNEATVELAHGELLTKEPKSKAGVRTLHIAPSIMDEVESHLGTYVEGHHDAYLFTGSKGGQLRRAVWFREWSAARAAIGLPQMHFHDLRHFHGTVASQEGATTKEIMRRLGHSSVGAAMVYQHAPDERDAWLAEAMGRRIDADLKAFSSGTADEVSQTLPLFDAR